MILGGFMVLLIALSIFLILFWALGIYLFVISSGKERRNLVLQLIILVIFGFILTYFIGNVLKPKTNISINCKISEGIGSDYTLEIFFRNNADFSGKNFYVYIFGVTSDYWGSDYSTSELCKRIQETEVDFTSRFKIYCEYIPPMSEFDFNIHTDLNEEIIEKQYLTIEWWGETTPYEIKNIYCEGLK